MKLTALSVDGFKNLKGVSLIPDPSYNLILGENAQGKTNLLEAIWTLTGWPQLSRYAGTGLSPLFRRQFAGRSEIPGCPTGTVCPAVHGFRYRTGKKDLVQRYSPEKQCPVFRVPLCHIYAGRPLSRRGRSGTAADVSGLVQCPAARPYAGAGTLRGTRVDIYGIRQLALQQRNAVLKQRLPEAQAAGLLEIWDRQLEQLGTEIAVQRGIYVRRLAEVCVPLYAQIARGRETVSLHYQSSVFGKDAQDTLPETRTPELVQQYGEKMRQSRSSDLLLGHTASGAHRDDLLLAIDGKPAKEFGSQGQKKSLALALKLAQAEIYSKRRKESPVVLLDDVMGELDEARQAVVSTIVQEMQVFVTTCHPESLLSPKNGKRFLLKDGMLTGDVENRPETA